MTARIRHRRFRAGRQLDEPWRRIDDVLPEVAAIYRSAVETVGPGYYDADQVAAWAAAADRPTELGRVLGRGLAVLRYTGRVPVAVGQIDDAGHLGLLYVRGGYGRQGHGGAVLAELLEHARAQGAARVTVEASWFSAHLFARHGFAVQAEERPVYGGVAFRRWRMCRVPSRATGGD
jgi:putative acetyltransferase